LEFLALQEHGGDDGVHVQWNAFIIKPSLVEFQARLMTEALLALLDIGRRDLHRPSLIRRAARAISRFAKYKARCFKRTTARIASRLGFGSGLSASWIFRGHLATSGLDLPARFVVRPWPSTPLDGCARGVAATFIT
jgi:hypothetical protein